MEQKPNYLKIQGTIVQIEDAIQGETWVKQEFTIRTNDKYPELVNFICFKTAQEQLTRCKENDKVEVYFNIKSKQFTKDGKSRWFTEVIAWKISIDWKGGINE
jgi:hypothetical protein